MSNYRNPQIHEILTSAEAKGGLGSTSTFNQVVDVLSKSCNATNIAAMEQYLMSLECAKGISNAGAILRHKAGL
ncbi:hypothetical protein [Aeromonas jandaei]|uniref:hypothetical protein n=1 Tax=Aeromonas jandaei TaxID=650 RepID=UPI003B9E99AE